MKRLDWTRWMGRGAGSVVRLALGASLGLAVATGSIAEASDVVTTAAADSGRVWLVEASTGSVAFSGELQASMSAALSELGGALLISGRVDERCGLEVSIGEARVDVSLATRMSVVHVEVPPTSAAAPGTASSWSVRTTSSQPEQRCEMDLEGAVLFVGEASAYVGENPGVSWAGVRAARGVGVR